MGKRIAILIGVAALGVMALGAAASAVGGDYDTTVTIKKERGEGGRIHGEVTASSRPRNSSPAWSEARKCERRRVLLRRDAPEHHSDQTVGFDRSRLGLNGEGVWTVPKSSLKLQRGWHSLLAKVKFKVRDGFVCGNYVSEAIRVFVR